MGGDFCTQAPEHDELWAGGAARLSCDVTCSCSELGCPPGSGWSSTGYLGLCKWSSEYLSYWMFRVLPPSRVSFILGPTSSWWELEDWNWSRESWSVVTVWFKVKACMNLPHSHKPLSTVSPKHPLPQTPPPSHIPSLPESDRDRRSFSGMLSLDKRCLVNTIIILIQCQNHPLWITA